MNATNLIGSWTLLGWRISYSDGRPESYPYGESPQGLLIYSDDGWMSAAISRSDRPAMDAGIGLRQQAVTVLADACTSYFHYAGSYHVEGKMVFHEITQSLNPNFVGSRQERHISFENGCLVLTGYEQINEMTRTHRLEWLFTGDKQPCKC